MENLFCHRRKAFDVLKRRHLSLKKPYLRECPLSLLSNSNLLNFQIREKKFSNKQKKRKEKKFKLCKANEEIVKTYF
jgi:hypothetical protein